MAFDEEDYLLLSGLQHFKFCRRQWALIHIENQWADNLRTTEGEIMHEKAHDSSFREVRNNTLIRRDVKVFSASLGITGACDIVEFRKDPGGIPLVEEEGLYLPFPVEYKHGAPRTDSANELQLCAQAMCLEEMLCCDVLQGALYFGETRHRITVSFTQDLRQEVRELLSEMHMLFSRGYTPKVKPSKSCNACSLKEVCLPKLMRTKTVAEYLHLRTEDQDETLT